MATGTAALQQKLAKKQLAASNGKKVAKKTTSTKKSGPTKSRADVPWTRIAELYNKGLSVSEISDKLDLTRPKTKKGKENPYPYYLTVGYLTKLAHGVEVDGKTIRIVRGGKNKARAAKKSEK